MNRIVIISIVGLLISLISCNRDPDPVPQPNPDGNVFVNLAVGNTSTFVHYTGDNGNPFHEVENIQYQPDTLIVEVVGTSSQGFLMRESLTKGSQIMQDIRTNGGDSVKTYQLVQKVDGWEISPNPDSTGGYSWLLTNRSIPLAVGPDPTNGQLLSLTIADHTYEDLTLAYDYSPLAYDGPGYQLFYSMDEGIIRMTSIGSWFPISEGWDYLE